MHVCLVRESAESDWERNPGQCITTYYKYHKIIHTYKRLKYMLQDFDVESGGGGDGGYDDVMMMMTTATTMMMMIMEIMVVNIQHLPFL